MILFIMYFINYSSWKRVEKENFTSKDNNNESFKRFIDRKIKDKGKTFHWIGVTITNYNQILDLWKSWCCNVYNEIQEFVKEYKDFPL